MPVSAFRHPYTKNWGGYKNDVNEMIRVFTFQTINNVLYFFKLGGIEIFLYPHPLTQKKLLGGYKNDVTEMVHLLPFQLINNVLHFYYFLFGS